MSNLETTGSHSHDTRWQIKGRQKCCQWKAINLIFEPDGWFGLCLIIKYSAAIHSLWVGWVGAARSMKNIGNFYWKTFSSFKLLISL